MAQTPRPPRSRRAPVTGATVISPRREFAQWSERRSPTAVLTLSLALMLEVRHRWPRTQVLVYPRTRAEFAEFEQHRDEWGLGSDRVRCVPPFAQVAADELPVQLEQDLGGFDAAKTGLVLDTFPAALSRRLNPLPRFGLIAAPAGFGRRASHFARHWIPIGGDSA